MNRRKPRLHSIAGLWICIFLLQMVVAFGQGPQFQQQPQGPPVNQSENPLLKNFKFRSIGLASVGGRIDDIAAVDSNPYIIYVGFATGGIWKTVNNGTTWEPIFDKYSVSSIGDIAINQANPDIVWVGTGEANNRQSSTIGDGVYKSTDGGKTFTNMGLKDTQSIARIVLDPKDPNIAYVAAMGHLFGPNKERGLFKTIDGGKTWTNTKFIDEHTGFTDVVMDPVDSKILYAASYQRERKSWGYNGGGAGSGLWKTIDAAKTWTRIEGNGFPSGGGVLGRMGIDVSRSNPNVIMAIMEVGNSPGTGGGVGPNGEEQAAGGGGGGGGGGGRQNQQANTPPVADKTGVYRSEDKGKTWKVVSNTNDRPMYYSQIRIDPKNDQIVYIGGAPFFKSTEGGKNFKQVQGIIHTDNHGIYVNPLNGNEVILGNDGGLDFTYDQGATWEFVNVIPAGQFYALAADMRRPYNVCGGLQDNGSWCGPSATRSQAGPTNPDWFRVGGGDGFYTQIDPTDYNTIYAESQNGAMNRLDLRTGRSVSIRPRTARRPGQGNQPAPSGESTGGETPTPPQPQGFGFGQPATSNINPALPAGEQFRWNWDTPIVLSPHNPRIIYTGANRFFKSLDRGDTWMASEDLTKHIDRSTLPIMGVDGKKPMASKHDGMENYSNIVTIAESPALAGIIWVGTDDGNLQLSKDGGSTWANLGSKLPGLPKDTYQISRVEPSHFDAGTCYVSVEGHYYDDYKPYLYVTHDFGGSWEQIANNLPMGKVNVVREDIKNKNLIFVGHEFGLFISLDGGKEWQRFSTGLPTVRIDDILIHPRDNDLIIGTHGRSIYILDDISALQQWDAKAQASDAFLFNVRPGIEYAQDTTLTRSVGPSKNFRGENPQPGTAISYYLKSAPTTDVKITISDVTGKVVKTLTGPKEVGINRVDWNLSIDPPPGAQGGGGGGRGGGGGGGGAGGGGGGGRGGFRGIPVEPGQYLVKLTVDGKEFNATKVEVLADTFFRE